MRYSSGLLLGLLSLCLSVLLLVGCAPELEDEASAPEEATPAQEDSQAESELQVPQGQNDELNNDCDAIKSELEVMQVEYDELSSEYSDLSTKYSELSTKYNDLKADYDELSVKYNTLIEGTAGISEEDVEQAIFEVINQDRQNNGLNELEWTDSIYWWAKEHSDYMAARKRLELSDYSYWQDIFRAAGYSTVDRIANAALMVWKESPQYEGNFLNEQANYGVVAVSKSGEIFYITYFAHMSK